MKNFHLALLSILFFSGCGKIVELSISDNDRRIELQKSAESEMSGIHLITKVPPSSVCNINKPRLNRYLCWRYYEIGGDVWRYAWFGKSHVRIGNYILIKNNTPIATGGNGWRYYSDRDKNNELGYEIIKEAMMPPERESLIHPNKEQNRIRYERMFPINPNEEQNRML